MRITLYFVLYFLTSGLVFGMAGTNIQSILDSTKSNYADTIRIEYFLRASDYYKYKIPDSSVYFNEQALKIATAINDHERTARTYKYMGIAAWVTGNYSEAEAHYNESLRRYDSIYKFKLCTDTAMINLGKAGCHMNLGTLFMDKGNFALAINNFEKAERYFSSLNNKEGLYMCKANLGNMNRKLGNLVKSLEYFQEALTMAELIKDTIGIAGCQINIGIIHNDLDNKKMAIEYYEQALDNFEAMSSYRGISACLTNIGLIYDDMDSVANALKYYNKALDISQQMGDRKNLTSIYSSIALIHVRKEDYKEAERYFRLSLAIDEQMDDKISLAETLLNLAGLGLKSGNYKESLNFAKRSLSIGIETGALPRQAEAYELLAQLHEARKDPAAALEFYKQFVIIKDSILNKEMHMQLSEIEGKYQNEKKQLEIANLQNIKALQQSELKQKDIRLHNQTLVIVFVLVGFIIVLISSLWLLKMYRQKKKTNRIMLEKNEEIVVQNEEIKAQNEQLAELNNKISASEKALKELNATKDKFFSIVAHDLKNPFSILQSLSTMLNEKYDSLDESYRKKVIETIKTSIDSSYILVENLLQWSRTQSGKMSFHTESISLNDLIQKNVLLVNSFAESKKIEIAVIIEGEIKVLADLNSIDTILRNLISNALKFTEPNGRIEIGAHIVNDYIEIYVKDSGIGIKQTDTDKLFRIDVDTATIGSSKEKGTGLGLILCKEFAEANGGSISLDSIEGKGTTVFLKLKLV